MLSLLMKVFGKKIKKKQIKNAVLIIATLSILLSGIIPFLGTLIQ